MRERDIEKILVDEVKKAGGIAFTWISPGNDGVPDRIVILPDKPVQVVELKTATGRLSGLQEAQLERLLRLGQEVSVLYGLAGLGAFFSRMGLEKAECRVRRRMEKEAMVK